MGYATPTFHFNFDLSEKDEEILNNRDEDDFSISYYESRSNAENDTNSISSVTTDHIDDIEVFYRLEKNDDPSCFVIDSFMVSVIKTDMRMDEIVICGNPEGFAEVELVNLDSGMLGGQDPAIHEVTYYLTEQNAEDQVNQLDKNSWNTIDPDFQEIFVRVQRTDENPCFHVKFFHFYVNRSLDLDKAYDENICFSGDPANYSFDLHQKDQEILDGEDPQDYEISYFENRTDAEAGNNPVTQVNGSSSGREIFIKVEKLSGYSCNNIGSFMLNVQNSVSTTSPQPIQYCSSGAQSNSFDLSQKDAEILGGLDSAEYTISYHPTASDANNDLNPLNKTAYTCSADCNSVFARVSSVNDTQCYGVQELKLESQPPPSPELEANYQICSGGAGVQLDGGDFESWEWFDENNDLIGNSRTIEINEPGNYELRVSNSSNSGSCYGSTSFLVELNQESLDFEVEIQRLSNSVRLEVQMDSPGEYEYSLDGHNFQDSDSFEIQQGEYTVFVKRKDGCGLSEKRVVIPGYQTFFTPNGDGINDQWKIVATENGKILDVLIYDRYGKLLAQILGGKMGWDGTFNGKPMPSDDYWFQIRPENSEMISGHFSLVRE